MRSGTGYRSIVYKIFLCIEWMVDHVNPKFVLKTDDDAYVDPAAITAELRKLCVNPDCREERCVTHVKIDRCKERQMLVVAVRLTRA
jgi:Galactosyltransferase